MPERILFVDDDRNLLDGLRRNLANEFPADYACGPGEALVLLNSGIPYSVVIADMQMPGMNGIQFLTQVKSVSPRSIRIMFTGNADVGTAVDAVNQGSVFKFLTKPCPMEMLKEALSEGIQEYRARAAEYKAANIDPLTGLNNRRRLEEKISGENELRKRYPDLKRRKYSVVFMDLDNFKYYNDTHGHPVGDLLLKEFAGILTRVIRTADFAARFGGDEFFLLLPETGTEGACTLAGRIKEELEREERFIPKIELLTGKKVIPVHGMELSCSIGIAEMSEDIDLTEALKRADESVLQAKRFGKNCFVVWEKP
jgi:two-component system, cell cycle response regulator